MRRGRALVRGYAAALAGVDGALQGVQKRVDVADARRRRNASNLVIFSEITDPSDRRELKPTHLESRPGRSGS